MSDAAHPRPEVLILRHYKEKRKKCSLEPLVGRPGFVFVPWRPGQLVELEVPHILLEVGAPPLAPSDAGQPLLLLDSTWRYLPSMRAAVRGELIPRSFPPGVRTAYPRTSKLFDDPETGLASIEALYLAFLLLGHPDESLLEAYRWKDAFLRSLEPLLQDGSQNDPLQPR
ncbi:MAG TPA: hypothetical protein ENK02_01160 [Planctomycetes bacterium]|nr:hypothetical protein [Planctomycetota bacterium]